MNDKPITPIAVAVVTDSDRVLIGRRPAGVVLPGLWEFPGGKIARGETPAQAAARECQEEAGLEVVAGRTLDATQYTYDHGTISIHFVACKPSHAEAPIQPPFRWVARQELGNYEFPAANAKVVRLLIDAE